MIAATQKNKGRKENYAQDHFRPASWCGAAATGAALGTLVVWLCYRDLRAAPVAVAVAVLYVRAQRRARGEAGRAQLLAHFKEALQAIYGSLCAGYSLENALSLALRDMEKLYGTDDALVRELREIRRGLSLQIPIEKLFYDLGVRSGVGDIRQFGEILMIAKRTGGNLDAAIRRCYRTICERIDLQQEIDALTAAKRFEYRIMCLMPAGIILYSRVSFGGFMDVLYGSLTGALIMTAALGIYGAALWIGGRLIRIGV